jgi:predicted ATPase
MISAHFSDTGSGTGHPAGRLVVLEGMPGAGKTTLAAGLAAEGAAVLGEYTTPAGATIPLSGHPGAGDGAAHNANWVGKARQAAAARCSARAVYVDRDWLSALAYAYSIADIDGGQLLRERCAWAQDCLADGRLLLADTYVIFHVTAATSLRRRAGVLQDDHPWSHPGPLGRLRYFYTWPAQVISGAHPGLGAALLAPAWHRVPGTGGTQSRLRLLRQLGTGP